MTGLRSDVKMGSEAWFFGGHTICPVLRLAGVYK
jgi:hypothetical protein